MTDSNTNVTNVKLLPKQMEFIQSHKKEVLYSGAFGAGKSRSLCYKVLERALIPGNTVGLCRKTLVALRGSTLRTLLFPDGELPPVLPPGTYDWHKSEQRITLHGGGNIVYFGCDDPIKIGSMHGIGSIGVDEATELDEDEWIMLLGRCRNTVDDVRQLFAATNPGSPSHFLHRRFFEEILLPEYVNQRECICTKSTDNTFLPADYIDMLLSFTGNHRKRYVDGVWVAFEGLVYGEVWDRSLHLKKRHKNTRWPETVVGIDDGFTNPAVVCKWGIDGDRRMHGQEIWYERKQLPTTVVQVAKTMAADIYVVDPSAAALIAMLEEEGLNVVPADNDVDKGIKYTMNRLKKRADGRSRLTFDPSFTPAIIEMESYSWDKDKDKPLKELDHFCDQMRYVVMYLDSDLIDPTVALVEEGKPLSADPENQLANYRGRPIKRITREEPVDEYLERIMNTKEAWAGQI